MDRIYLADWLMPSFQENEAASEFFRAFTVAKQVKKATLFASALGIYVARINGEKISYPLAPGWTAYHSRVQYQEYDVTDCIKGENTLSLTAACGWRMDYGFGGNLKVIKPWEGKEIAGNEYAVIAALLLEYADGTEECILTDESWSVKETKWRYCNLYQGDVYDETFEEEIEYTIVGSNETNPMENKISEESPIGRALAGAAVGETVKAETPGGDVTMKILEISK